MCFYIYLIYRMSTGQDFDKKEKKPDFMIGAKYKINGFFFLKSRKPNSSKYQSETDTVKLLKHTKNSIDNQTRAKINNAISLRLLIEGIY